MIKKIRRTLVASVIVCLSGCATSSSSQLVGVWREDSLNFKAVILRNSDAEYIRKRIQDTDETRPPSYIVDRGNWWIIDEDHYFLEATEKSIDHGEFRRGRSGEVVRFDVESVTPVRFVYRSPDGAVVTERKIAAASEVEFDNATVSMPGRASEHSGTEEQ